MRKFIVFFVLFFTISAKAIPLGDFKDPGSWILIDQEKRGQSLTQQALPGISENALKLTWDGMTFRYAELHLRSPVALPGDFKAGTLGLRIWLPAQASVRCVNLRLIDGQGEVFQYQMRCMPQLEAGTRNFEYFVDLSEQHSAAWGGNKDKKLDLPVSLLGFSVDFSSDSVMDTVIFAGLTVTSKMPSVADFVRFDVETGSPVHVLRPGDEQNLKLVFRNAGPERISVEAEAEYEDFYGHTIKEKLPDLDLIPEQALSVPVRSMLTRKGHWNVRVKLTAVNSGSVFLQRSFAYFLPVGPRSEQAKGFLWGISSHPQLHPPAIQKLEALASALVGATVVREDVYWNRVQPTKGQWDFHSFDQTVEIFAEQGIELEAILCYCAPWAAKNPQSVRPDRAEPESEYWREFCNVMAKRYKGKIRFWEVWNEPDVSPFSDIPSDAYARMMLVAYKAVKEANPGALVLTGGFATLSNHPMLKEPDYQEQALRKGKGAYDIHAYHEHGVFYPHFVRMVEERFLPLRKRTDTTVPWWANETALTSAGENERPQALALYKKLIFAWGNGAIGYNWYDLRNDGKDPNHGEHNYGMMSQDFYPKPVYSVYNAMTTVFRGKEFVKRLEAGSLDFFFLFQDQNEMVLAAWNERNIILPTIIHTDAKSAKIFDLMGNCQSVTIHDGRILLEIGNEPVSLRVIGASKLDLAGNMIQPEITDAAVPNRNYHLALGLSNPLSIPAVFHLKLHAPNGVTPGELEHSITIPAGETRQLSFEFQVTDKFKSTFGVPVNFMAEYQITGDYKGRIAVPVPVAQLIPATSITGRDADFTLNQRGQIRELFATDPSKGHLLWRGARDLSGLVWLGCDNDNLLLRVQVTDDIHKQAECNDKIWLGDSVQFAFELPDKAGLWELGLARMENGEPATWCWSSPGSFNAKSASSSIRLLTSREGNRTNYDATIPLSALGLTPDILKKGFRFNLLINDNDGEGRKTWINISPGIGESKDANKFPLTIFL